jgi:hypothetical protein
MSSLFSAFAIFSPFTILIFADTIFLTGGMCYGRQQTFAPAPYPVHAGRRIGTPGYPLSAGRAGFL